MTRETDKGGWNPQSQPVEQHAIRQWTATFLDSDGITHLLPMSGHSLDQVRQEAAQHIGHPGTNWTLVDVCEGRIEPKDRAAHDANVRRTASN